MREKEIQTLLINLLNIAGHHVWNTNAGKIPVGKGKNKRLVNLAPAGTADIIGVHKDGRFIAIEVKTPKRKGNVTVLQQSFLDEVKKRGGIARVAWSEEQVQDLI